MRTTRVTIDKQAYDIPNAWLMGQSQRGFTVLQSAMLWHEQVQMANEWAADLAKLEDVA